jgi:serine/threonine protein kinase/tetratricopeptide (TPR) repeat protein
MTDQIVGNRYEIIEPIGQGGFATVFKGRDLQTGETVAVKRLKREVVEFDPGMVERFTREAEALRKLNHPSIVKALALIEEDGQHFAVMEYVSGGDLRSLLEREGKLPAQRVMEIALDLTDALARAHRLKIIHRDIKPANVLLAEDGTPRLTDFGIARFVDSVGQMQTGQMMGTLAYLSPEGCVGEALDHRTDIWSFGVMMYEMLAGIRPFEAPDGNHAALLVSILSHPAPPLRDYAPEAPRALVHLIKRMLEKDRDERIQSVRQVGAHIEAILAGREVIDDEKLSDSRTALIDDDDSRTRTPTQQALSRLQHKPAPTPTPTPIVTFLEQEQRVSQKSSRLNPLILVGGGFLLVLLIAAALLLPGLNRAANVLPVVEAVGEGEYMILVAPLEMIGGAEDNVSRFIVDDLRGIFEREVRFSPYRIRQYPEVILSEAQAAVAAEANKAAVVIWGNYDGDTARINLRLGSLAVYDEIALPRDQLDAMTSVTYLVKDPRRESLSGGILGIMNSVQTANNSAYDIALNLAILDQIKPISPEVEGAGIAARWHRYFSQYLESSDATFEEIDAAIRIDGTNGILYAARGLSYIRSSVLQKDPTLMGEALRDLRTGGRLLPPSVITDELGIAQVEITVNYEFDAGRNVLNEVLAAQPDNWYALFLRGITYHMQGDYDRAWQDFERSITINPDFPAVYPFAMAITLHQGELMLSQQYFQTLSREFPDPSFTERLLTSSFGLSSQDSPLLAGISAVGNFAVLQWNDMIENTEVAASLEAFQLPEVYLLRGVAFCNLGDFEASEAAYTKALEVDPDFMFAHALRADVRRRTGNLIGLTQDAAAILGSPLASKFTPLMPAFQSGEITCENFFDIDLTQYFGTPPAS